MRPERPLIALAAGLALAAPADAGEKADIDTSPRVFASASGKYYVRVTTKREWTDDGSKWTTRLTLSHAEGGRTGYADDRVVSETVIDTFPMRMLVSEFGDMIALSHADEVAVQGVITVYDRDGKRRGSTGHMELIGSLPGGGYAAPRSVARERLVSGQGAEFLHHGTVYLVIPQGGDRVAKISLENGRPAE